MFETAIEPASNASNCAKDNVKNGSSIRMNIPKLIKNKVNFSIINKVIWDIELVFHRCIAFQRRFFFFDRIIIVLEVASRIDELKREKREEEEEGEEIEGNPTLFAH